MITNEQRVMAMLRLQLDLTGSGAGRGTEKAEAMTAANALF